ncbi:MAG: M61 family metallopeptidase [Spirulinaceae cyanobacterium SM2_1_0]|nr:M61 family metallopeptidase [Spirulinaceae cyanobacterium SM2_1_0]
MERSQTVVQPGIATLLPMTEAIAHRPTAPATAAPHRQYTVALPEPTSHLFEVTLAVAAWSAPTCDLKMPVWTPGSYLVREYAKQVQDFTAWTGDRPLPSTKQAKNHWRIETAGVNQFTIRYRVFANELTVRTNHLDASHGYFNGAALFMYLPGQEQQPWQVTVIPPHPNWQVTTALPPVTGQPNTFLARDFDTLVDSPFEIGTHALYDFTVRNKPHRLAVWGRGNFDAEQAIADIRKIIAVEADLFGDLPYEQYLFILHLSANNFGGLEHKDSCSLIYPRFGFQSPDQYHRFTRLVAHEFFHLWNVKRIRPLALESFDYERENYTPSLWFCEGTTSYYDTLIPCWAGVYDGRTALDLFEKDISRFLLTPGRKVQTLSESSFDAWIKLYRRDANSDNTQISYYLKGELVSLLLDLAIRARSDNQRSLNQVLQKMWQQFGREERGFTPAELRAVLEAVAGFDLSAFYAAYIDGLAELPFDDFLAPFGLRLKAAADDKTPYLGVKLTQNGDRADIQFVASNSPAARAGLDAGDELLALDGLRVTATQLNSRLSDYQPGDRVTLTAFHFDELLTTTAILGEPQPTRYQLVPMANPTPEQQALLAGWLQVEAAEIFTH